MAIYQYMFMRDGLEVALQQALDLAAQAMPLAPAPDGFRWRCLAHVTEKDGSLQMNAEWIAVTVTNNEACQ